MHQSLLDKIATRSMAEKTVNDWRKEGHRIVFTNGVFDILHLGHVSYLAEAAEHGDKLILGLNSNDSVKGLGKGDDRPINRQSSRAGVVASLTSVDLVVIFDEDTPLDLITALKPDVLIKGGDYVADCEDSEDNKYIVGSREVKSAGGEVKVIEFLPGHSTTAMIETIRNGH